MLKISNSLHIPANEVEIKTIRAKGPGGQHVNKVATAIQIRFDIKNSSLPEVYKRRLLSLNDQRITNDGVIIIKSREHRSQFKNKEAALNRLQLLIRNALVKKKKRIATKPTNSSQIKRLEAKSHRGKIKQLRGKIKITDP